MKRKIWVVMALLMPLLLTVNTALACSACGCSMGNYNPELMMSVGNHSIGLFNQTRWFSTRLVNHELGLIGTTSKYIQIHTLSELRGTWYIHNRLSLTGILPLNRRVMKRDGDMLEQHTGLGDALLTVNAILLRDGKKIESKGYRQQLSLGAGLKFPTGQFNGIGHDGEVSPQMQNGTGSFDFIFLGSYFIKLKRFALSAYGSYKVNTTNKNNFRFGNSFNAEVRSTYFKEFKKVTLSPGIGARFEGSGSDMYNGDFYELDTGGNILYLLGGMELYHKNVSFSAQYLQPVYSKLIGLQYKVNGGIQAGFKYTFSKKNNTKTS